MSSGNRPKASPADMEKEYHNGMQAIHKASLDGNLEEVEWLLDSGDNISRTDNSGLTALHLASGSGHLDVAKLLIERGADVNQTDGADGAEGALHPDWMKTFSNADVNRRFTPLGYASLNGHADVVNLLIDSGAHFKASITCKCRIDDIFVSGINDLFVSCPDTSNSTRWWRRHCSYLPFWSPLHYASWGGHTSIAKLLVDRGSDVNETNGDGWAPLHLASAQGRLPIVELLIDSGAGIDKVNKRVATMPVHTLLVKDHPTVEGWFVHQGGFSTSGNGGVTPLHLACTYGHLSVVRHLVVNGADVNRKIEDMQRFRMIGALTDMYVANLEGSTPLHIACEKGFTDVARLLMEKGADIHATDANDWTALHYASRKGDVPTAKLLIDAGGGMNRVTDANETELIVALQYHHVPVAQLLIENGADVLRPDAYGTTLLHRAATIGDLNIAKLLVARGANVSSSNAYGDTPLHRACETPLFETVECSLNSTDDICARKLSVAAFLIEQGADIYKASAYGQTPLDMATLSRNAKAVRFLLDNGAKSTARDLDR